MSKAIPGWRVVFTLKPNAIERVKDWYSYDEGNPKKPPVPQVHLCGPIKIGSALEFSVCVEEEAHSLASHIQQSGFVDDHKVMRI